MEEWAKSLIETVWIDEQDSPIIHMIKDLLKLADKELYLRAREKKITIRQFKTRCMEILNGNQFPFIDYDDVVHLIHPDCRNLDMRKVDKWAMAVYGKHLDELPLKGPDSFVNGVEDWAAQPRCLRSIANFFMPEKRAVSTAANNGRKGRQRYRGIPIHREWDFQNAKKIKPLDKAVETEKKE